MAEQTYTITLDDVQAYLDSKQDDEVVGVTCDADACLLTNAFRHKYPQTRIVEAYFGKLFVDGEEFTLDAHLHTLYCVFDQMHSWDSYEVPITKREWLAAQEVRL